jgi:hypothetical protein
MKKLYFKNKNNENNENNKNNNDVNENNIIIKNNNENNIIIKNNNDVNENNENNIIIKNNNENDKNNENNIIIKNNNENDKNNENNIIIKNNNVNENNENNENNIIIKNNNENDKNNENNIIIKNNKINNNWIESYNKNINNILLLLIKNQRSNIPFDKKMSYSDLKRISKYLNMSIFNNDECVLWSGYITTIKHDDTKSYINFYYNGKKFALHRLLYINYINDLNDSEYIKFSCCNKGKCCNINHFYKVKNDNENDIIKNNIEIINIKKKDNIIVDFD